MQDNPEKLATSRFPRAKEIASANQWHSIPTALTYDDVLIVPNYSTVHSRSDVTTDSKITPSIEVNIPIISSNMDTVTEAPMAIAMAREGGIGFIHRFMSIEEQVSQVNQVKRSESILIQSPYTLVDTSLLKHAWDLLADKNVSGILVVNEDQKLVGILTQRDILFEENPNIPIKDLMTTDMVTASPDIDLIEAKAILKSNRVEKLPLVDGSMTLKGLITSSDLIKTQKWPDATKDSRGRLQVGAAIGVKGAYLHRAEALVNIGCDILVIDIAHGHSDLCINTIQQLRKDHGDNVQIIAGNVATAQGTSDLIFAGADGVKVGVGPGSICITRQVAGAGVPQLTAVMEAAVIGQDAGIPIIADGGVRTSGDIVKAIAAGASTVMLGSLLAGTSESPGVPVLRNGRQVKIIRGMASLGASLGRDNRVKGSFDGDLASITPEGVEAIVPYRGSVTSVLSKLIGGLRSGMSYIGATSVEEMWDKARFVRITPAGVHESGSHDVDKV